MHMDSSACMHLLLIAALYISLCVAKPEAVQSAYALLI